MIWAPAAIASLIGAALGMIGLIAPNIAARIVRLQADPAMPDGAAEFRASFGGLFFAVHAACLAAIILAIAAPVWISPAAIACAMAGLVWWGTAMGRIVAVIADPVTRTGYQYFAIGFELVLGAMLAAPALDVILGR